MRKNGPEEKCEACVILALKFSSQFSLIRERRSVFTVLHFHYSTHELYFYREHFEKFTNLVNWREQSRNKVRYPTFNPKLTTLDSRKKYALSIQKEHIPRLSILHHSQCPTDSQLPIGQYRVKPWVSGVVFDRYNCSCEYLGRN